MCIPTEDLAHLGWQLSHLPLMVQAAVLAGEFFGFLSPFDDCGVSPEGGVSGGDVAAALMVAVVKVFVSLRSSASRSAPIGADCAQRDA